MSTRIETSVCSRTHDSAAHRRAVETDDLLRSAATGSQRERNDQLEQVVLLHLEVADALAHRYAGRGAETADLEQVARLALVEAVERADPDRGDFLPFAVTTIRGCLKRHFRDHCWLVRPPRRIQELQVDIGDTWSELAQAMGHVPSTREVAQTMERSAVDVGEAQAAGSCFRPRSLDAPVRSGESTGAGLGALLGYDEAGYAAADWTGTIRPALTELSETDRRMLYLRFYEELTQQQIADELEVSQMQISRALRRVLTLLRSRIDSVDEASMPLAA